MVRSQTSIAIAIVLALVFLALAGARQATRADAIMVTKAMTASTIAEIFIEEGAVSVELEIGITDLAGFRNLMPDDIYERMGFEPEPFEARLRRFMTEDWTLRLSDGSLVAGRLDSLAVRPRIRRDEITGEPVVDTAGEVEPVVFAVLRYGLSGRPETLTFGIRSRGDGRFTAATVGFVVYHEGLPVTDFRYLGVSETLHLDWKDPWYSRFENRNLRRRFDSPLSAFIYIENYEVRKEIIARPRDLQQWVDLGIEGLDTIPAAAQEEIKARVVAFLADRAPVTIDGRSPEPVLDRIHFLRRTLRNTRVVDPPEDLPAVSATLGIIYVYPVDSLPDDVTMAWGLFTDRINRVPTSSTDEAGGMPYFLTPDDSILHWQNFLTHPTVPALTVIKRPSGGLPVPVPSVLCLAALVAVLVWASREGRYRRPKVALVAVVLSGASVALFPVAKIAVPVPGMTGMSRTETEAVVTGLITNVYRAFDYRDEEVIYDTLERSASGELLTDIYLETRKALELQSQGGARVKVKEVDLSAVVARPADGGGFVAECTWIVSGSVGHWGHLHTRRNQYDALLTIRAVDGVWKITEMNLLEERRVL